MYTAWQRSFAASAFGGFASATLREGVLDGDGAPGENLALVLEAGRALHACSEPPSSSLWEAVTDSALWLQNRKACGSRIRTKNWSGMTKLSILIRFSCLLGAYAAVSSISDDKAAAGAFGRWCSGVHTALVSAFAHIGCIAVANRCTEKSAHSTRGCSSQPRAQADDPDRRPHAAQGPSLRLSQVPSS